jgi:hypothetical protein
MWEPASAAFSGGAITNIVASAEALRLMYGGAGAACGASEKWGNVEVWRAEFLCRRCTIGN